MKTQSKIILLLFLFAILFSDRALAAEKITNLINEASIEGNIQLFDFKRDFESELKTSHDTSLGGLLYIRSGEVSGVSFGAAFASANPISNSTDNIYGLLPADASNQRASVNRFQEYFVQGSWNDTTVTIGANELNTPMMNTLPLRAIPLTYRGGHLENHSYDDLTISTLYITDFMGWTDNNFNSIASGVKNDLEKKGQKVNLDNNPMLAIGLDYEILLHGMNSTTSIWHYSMKDVYNQTYLGLEIDKNIGNSNWYLKPSYLKQDSIGKLDQTRAKFDTYQAGIHLGAKWRGFDATVKYAKTGEADIIAPFGDKKVVTQQVMQSSRENERVYSAKLAYRFREETPLHGLSAYINYGLYQFEKNPDSDITETEISMHYQLSGFLKGMAFRVRHSFVDYETGTDIKDTRFYLFYKFII